MKIAIIGAGSFLGRQLVNRTDDHDDVIAVIRRGGKKYQEFNKSNVNIIEYNMDEYYKLGDELGYCDCAVYFSWNGTRGKERLDDALQKENVKYGFDAVKSLMEAGCKKIVTSGSQAEYGNWCKELITEEIECKPNTAYGKYKYRFFEKLMNQAPLFDATIIEPRYFSIYGPADFENTLIMSCIRHMLTNTECKLTLCTQQWNYLYITDAINALYSLCAKNCDSGAYNVASKDTRVIKEFVEEIKTVLKSSSPVLYGAIQYPETGAVSINPSIQKIMNSTGWKPEVSFEDGILSIVRENNFNKG